MKLQDMKIGPVEKPVQFKKVQKSEITISTVEVDSLIRASQARQAFQVDGSGLTVAVLDTGLRTTHQDFSGRVLAQANFTPDNGGDPQDAKDGNGHGTNVAGIIAAGAIHTGIAPKVNVVPIKVLTNSGGGNFGYIDQALEWIRLNPQLNISVICMSLGDSQNHLDDSAFYHNSIRARIGDFANNNVATVVAAGNDFFPYQSQQGMAFPAILRESVSVGAVYDAFEGPFSYQNGAQTIESGPNRITPFSQRLHSSKNSNCFTKIFAPGAPVTSSGILNDTSESTQHGTSQAAPVTAGVIVLVQEYFLMLTGYVPPISFVTEVIRNGAFEIFDGDDEQDNVVHTQKYYRRLDAVGALSAVNNKITKELYLQGQELNQLTLI